MPPEEWLCCVRSPRGEEERAPDKMAAKLVIHFHTLELEFREKSIFARISNGSDRIVQGAELASGLLPDVKPEVCHGEDFQCVTFSWRKFGSLVVKHVQHAAAGIEYRFEWTHRSSSGTIRDLFLMQSAHWYGAAQVRHQHWPIEKWSRAEAAYVTGDSFQDQYGGVMERYWLSSNGVAIFVEEDVPLFVGMNSKEDGMLSLCSKWSSPYRNIKDEKARLSYRIFIGDNVKSAHELATGQCIAKPEAIPDEMIFRYPIWSTWARYKKAIDQQIIMEFARDIKRNGFKAAQVEIDDDWTPRYGDNDFDESKFPNPKKMIKDLKDLGFRVTVWTHPFASPLSHASGEDYWIKSGFLPGHTTWWNGVGKILDVTNPEAVTWFKNSMKQLQEKYGITSFKFDAGETNWLPNFASPRNAWSSPNEYTTLYSRMCYECDTETRAQEVRVGWRTQNLPIFVRMMDKDSNWGFDNGLKSLIPHALTFSIIGYPFVLPDMIGGNAYSSFGIGSSSGLPEKELFIRWLQANVFLPSLQFSLCPWQYEDPEVLEISREMTGLHEKYANYFIELAHESVRTGAPIIRPMWWLAPNDPRALTFDDQFLVGSDIVVAPVVVKGATSRNIYLPPGQWNDMLKNEVVAGGKVYANHNVSLKELAYFTREGVEFDFTQPAPPEPVVNLQEGSGSVDPEPAVQAAGNTEPSAAEVSTPPAADQPPADQPAPVHPPADQPAPVLPPADQPAPVHPPADQPAPVLPPADQPPAPEAQAAASTEAPVPKPRAEAAAPAEISPALLRLEAQIIPNTTQANNASPAAQP